MVSCCWLHLSPPGHCLGLCQPGQLSLSWFKLSGLGWVNSMWVGITLIVLEELYSLCLPSLGLSFPSLGTSDLGCPCCDQGKCLRLSERLRSLEGQRMTWWRREGALEGRGVSQVRANRNMHTGAQPSEGECLCLGESWGTRAGLPPSPTLHKLRQLAAVPHKRAAKYQINKDSKENKNRRGPSVQPHFTGPQFPLCEGRELALQ